MQISDNQYKVADEIVDLIASAIGQNRIVHSITAIATSARLSGAFLFKSFRLNVQDAKPGTAVLSQHANEEGPELIIVIRTVLLSLGVPVDNGKIESAGMQKANLDFLQSMNATQVKAYEVMRKYGLSDKEMAVACAISTGLIIQQCQNNLNVESALNTAVYGLIEGSKTVPPEMIESTTEQKKWYKFW